MSTIQIKRSFKRVNRFLKEGGRLLNNFSDNKVVVSYKDYLISTGNKNNTISQKIRFIYLLENYLFSIDKTFKTFTKENIYDYFNGSYSPHSLRHTKATHLYNNGTPLLYIKEFLGHSTVSSTEIYATPDSRKQRKEILRNSETINTKNKYNNHKKDDLDNWLKNNMK